MDKTKKKIRTIGKVSCIIIIILMIFSITACAASTIAGIGSFVINGTPFGDKISGYIEQGLNEISTVKIGVGDDDDEEEEDDVYDEPRAADNSELDEEEEIKRSFLKSSSPR